MSETPAMTRTLGGAEEFERRMRMIDQPASVSEDPLAELARLVGQDDPFKRVLAQGRSKWTQERQEPSFTESAAPPAADPLYRDPYDAVSEQPDQVPEHSDPLPHAEHFAAFDREFRGSLDVADQSGAPEEPAVVHGPGGYDYEDRQAYPSVSIGDHRPAEVSPDAWAQGDGLVSTPADEFRDVTGSRDEGPPTEGSSRRTLIVLAAVVVLTGGGLAASFLARPSAGTASALGIAPPTILATTGPTKVQPPAPTNGDEGASESSTLLDKNKSDGTATAKVVNTVEQPVDLNQAVKSTAPADDARPLASSSPFPEPRKVKTIMVRPDGSIITNPADGSPAAPRVADETNSINPDAKLAFDTHTAMQMPGQDAPPASPADTASAAPAAAAPAIPTRPVKLTARVATTPRTVVAAMDPGSAGVSPIDTQTPAVSPTKPKQAAAPVHTRPKPKPVEDASAAATPDSGASQAGGGFAVQLGAPPTEQEAKDASNRLQKKFADQLGAYRPAIHEGKSGDKSVFRIRVGNLSQDDAKSLCSKLQAGGGACFVVRN